jgi:RHS repeat-associated protein
MIALSLLSLCRVRARNAFLLFALAASSAFANHQEFDQCPDLHINGGESIAPDVTVRDTGQPVYDGMVLPTSTYLRFHMVGAAYGECDTYRPAIGGGCEPGSVDERKVASLPLDLFAKTTSLNGQYFLGQIVGKDPATGQTKLYHVLDSHNASTSTGPLDQPLNSAGVYRFRMRNSIYSTFCLIDPNRVDTYLTVYARDNSNDENLGCSNEKGKETGVGNPCDVAIGNKYQREVDSATAILPIVRHYNSQLRVDFGLGFGWLTPYHRRLHLFTVATGPTARARRSDGYSELFTKSAGVWVGEADSVTTLLEDASGFTLRYKDRSSDRYDLNGRLLSETDPSGKTNTLTYDSGTGRLAQVADDFGHVLTFQYNADGRISSITNPGNNAIAYTYDAEGNLTQVTYPDAAIRKYLYENTTFKNHLTGIEDPGAVRFATYAYNSSGKVTSSEHANGAGRVTLSYTNSTSTAVTDALNTARTLQFSRIRNAYRTTSISGTSCNWCQSSKSTSYDTNGNPSIVTDFKNVQTRYTYDLTRNLETSRTEAYGTPRARTITTQWHATFRVPTQIDEPGRRTTFTHDTNGNVLTKTVLDTATSDSRTWTYTYNTFGQVLTADGPRTDVTDVSTYTYYSCTSGFECGQLHTIANALGHITTYNTYNSDGQPLTITDPNGVVTTLTYDARQRLTSRTVGSEQTTFEYWPNGLLKKATLPDGTFLEYTYDPARRLTEIEDSEGNRIVYTLDAFGNRVAEQLYDPSSALTQTRTRVFNTLNQLWKEIGAAGTANVTTQFSYDNNSNQTGINAPLSRNTTQAYDELNRLTQVTDPLSGTIQFGYNALDQLISVTDPRSKVTSYTYNALGDLTQQVSPDTGTTTNTYDAMGNLLTSTDARSKTGAYSYDALNRVTSVTYPDQAISYTYDSGTNQKGRLTQVTDASGSTNWIYDTHGRVLSRQQSMGVSKTLGYAYDSAGRLQTLTLPSGNTISYGYTDGKVTSLTLNGSTTIISSVLYQPFGPTGGWTWGNGTLAIREYDADGKITDIDSAGLKTYSYDDAFRVTAITDTVNSSLSQSYGYDLLDRLTSAMGTSLNQGWTYDGNGNRLTQTGSAASSYTVSSTSNRLSNVSGALTRTYTYDTSGNALGDGTVTFAYNDAGRMVSATKASVTTTYALTALGQRVKKTTGGSSTYFVYDDGGHLVGEYDNAGTLIEETVWFGNAPVATLRPNGGTGVSLYYVHSDHLSTPRRISRPSDNVIVWRWDSDPFGTTVANEDPDGDSNLLVSNLTFPGQYFDTETGLHYNYFRDYDPQVGRYLQSDPIGLGGGVNTYGYVSGNPLNMLDPTGLEGATFYTDPRFKMQWGTPEDLCVARALIDSLLNVTPFVGAYRAFTQEPSSLDVVSSGATTGAAVTWYASRGADAADVERLRQLEQWRRNRREQELLQQSIESRRAFRSIMRGFAKSLGAVGLTVEAADFYRAIRKCACQQE